ncbi:hypothetical protein J6590_002319 [Homalodisca vitripennis]|nr:hypothetical protein J6590_002319 [Homalodisca vitripennis]
MSDGVKSFKGNRTDVHNEGGQERKSVSTDCLVEQMDKTVLVYTCVVPDVSSGRYCCNTCGRSYRAQRSLWRHIKFECGMDPKFSCPECDYKAKQKAVVVNHLLFRHNRSNHRPWSGFSKTRGDCIAESKGDVNENEVRSKDSTERSKRPSKRSYGAFSCSNCGRSYIRKDSLQRHVLWECGKEPMFQCPYCPQRCKRKSHYKRHIERQHQEAFLCPEVEVELDELLVDEK